MGARPAVAIAVAAALAMSCGGSTRASSGDAASDVAAESAPGVEPEAEAETAIDDAALDAGTDAPLTPGCPAAPPAAGTPCPVRSSCPLACEYGDDPRPTFNLIMGCDAAGSWAVLQNPVPSLEGGAPLDAGCPSSYAAAQTSSVSCVPSSVCSYPEGTCFCDSFITNGDAATALSCVQAALPPSCPATIEQAMVATSCMGLVCYYPGGTCNCEVRDAGARWNCMLPGAGCPAERPRIGTPCDADSGPRSCSYNLECTVEMTGRLFCCGGTWQGLHGPLCGP